MKIDYDKIADALYISLAKRAIKETREISENIFADIDANNNIIGIEVLWVSDYLGKKNSPQITINKKVLSLLSA